MSNFVNLLDIIYPIGSLYFNTSGVSPADSVGGTWEQIKDAVLAASGDSYSTTANTFGGNKAITVNQMPAHQHDMNYSLSGNNLSIPSNTGFTSQFGWICPNNPVRATGGAGLHSIPLFNQCMETNCLSFLRELVYNGQLR